MTQQMQKLQEQFKVQQERCLSCAYCWKELPEVFKSHPVHTYAYVHNQPQSDLEKSLSQKVLETCPAQAIVKIS